MKTRLQEQKRSSLDFSDSEDGDYKPRHYSKESSLEDVYSPDGKNYYDNDSLEGSFKPTPKSILKEYSGSASKGKKNIIINERLNETHRIAQKSESSVTSPDKSEASGSKYSKYNDYIREETGPSHGYSSRSGDTYSKSNTSDEEDDEDNLGPKYNRDSKPVGSTFKNRLVVGKPDTAGMTEFQKVHIRRLQQEREQELFSKGMRESADQVREKWLEEKARLKYGSGEYENHGSGRLHAYDDHGYSGQKLDTFGVRESSDAEAGEKFNRIEDKIAVLERDLNTFSKTSVQSTLRQEEKNRSLGKVYDDFEERMIELKEEINNSIAKSKSPEKRSDEYVSRGVSAEGSRKGKTLEGKGKKVAFGVSQSEKLKKSIDKYKGTSLKKKTAPSAASNVKRLQEEIEKLRNENSDLKNKLYEKEDEEKEKTKKSKTQTKVNLDREKELIETIDRIKRKLRKHITKKIQAEKDRQILEIKEEVAAQSFGRNYSSYGLHYKDVLKRKAFEDKTTAYSNYELLYNGLPTTYKSYEGPIFAQKLTKTTK